jgi:glycosyltransferase involved in cell wall biosynthesis
MQGVSVIICCYNSSLRIIQTLKHLAVQKTNDLAWEVIVVDNNCTDNTVHVVTKFVETHPNLPLKVVTEPIPGLSYARERGVLESRFETIVFCDDDNWLDADYVHNAFNLMNSDHSIGILGGNIKAEFDGDEPAWFGEYAGGYAIGEQAKPNARILEDRKWVYGAGTVIRKELFVRLKDLSIDLMLIGRKGKKLSAGDDSELCSIACILGYRVAASSSLNLKHFIPANRLKIEYARNLYKGFGASMPVIHGYEHVINTKSKANNSDWLARIWYFARLISPKQLVLSVFYPKTREMFFNKAYVILSFAAIRSLVSGRALFFAAAEQAFAIQRANPIK